MTKEESVLSDGVGASTDSSGHGSPAADADRGASQTPDPKWWHRDHPLFVALVGFYTGLAFAILVPGVFAAILAAMMTPEEAERWFPLVLVTLVVPLGLLAAPRTRRFAGYLWLGLISTLVVVLGVGALVLWLLLEYA